jgi:hypothetical protein
MAPTDTTNLTPQQRRLIAARAVMPERMVLRVYQDPRGRKPSVLERVRQAAAELGLPPPKSAGEAA